MCKSIYTIERERFTHKYVFIQIYLNIYIYKYGYALCVYRNINKYIRTSHSCFAKCFVNQVSSRPLDYCELFRISDNRDNRGYRFCEILSNNREIAIIA
jgi:hypothetical protein